MISVWDSGSHVLLWVAPLYGIKWKGSIYVFFYCFFYSFAVVEEQFYYSMLQSIYKNRVCILIVWLDNQKYVNVDLQNFIRFIICKRCQWKLLLFFFKVLSPGTGTLGQLHTWKKIEYFFFFLCHALLV